jgi:hypothetical protein
MCFEVLGVLLTAVMYAGVVLRNVLLLCCLVIYPPSIVSAHRKGPSEEHHEERKTLHRLSFPSVRECPGRAGLPLGRGGRNAALGQDKLDSRTAYARCVYSVCWPGVSAAYSLSLKLLKHMVTSLMGTTRKQR